MANNYRAVLKSPGFFRVITSQLLARFPFGMMSLALVMHIQHVYDSWAIAGFALGAGTALLGEKAAMACTAAVEEVIDEHYAAQVAELSASDPALAGTLERFRRDEVGHREEALEAGAAEAPGYELLSAAIKAGSRLAIWLSTRA